MLAAPSCNFIIEDGLREQMEEFSFRVAKLADDLNVLFMDVGEWELSRPENRGRSIAPEVTQKQFAESLARYLKEIGCW